MPPKKKKSVQIKPNKIEENENMTMKDESQNITIKSTNDKKILKKKVSIDEDDIDSYIQPNIQDKELLVVEKPKELHYSIKHHNKSLNHYNSQYSTQSNKLNLNHKDESIKSDMDPPIILPQLVQLSSFSTSSQNDMNHMISTIKKQQSSKNIENNKISSMNSNRNELNMNYNKSINVKIMRNEPIWVNDLRQRVLDNKVSFSSFLYEYIYIPSFYTCLLYILTHVLS